MLGLDDLRIISECLDRELKRLEALPWTEEIGDQIRKTARLRERILRGS